MDERGMGIIAIAILLSGVIVVGVAATGLGMYLSDAAIGATIKDKDCDPLGAAVQVETKLFGIDHTVEGIDPTQCGIIKKGNYVEYHLKSKRTVVFESEGGACIWDSGKSPGYPC